MGSEFSAIAMDPRIRNHWQGMTDYGFPSGHSVGAMMNAMFALAMAFSYLSRKRWWFAYLVFAWGVAICYSRPILREHSPTQVLAGGTIGVCLALFAVMLSRLIIDKYLAPASRQQTAS